jgi:hypothetical protein
MHGTFRCKPGGKGQFGRQRRGWQRNVKMDLKKLGVRICNGTIWIEAASSTLPCEYGNGTCGFIESLDKLRDCRLLK